MHALNFCHAHGVPVIYKAKRVDRRGSQALQLVELVQGGLSVHQAAKTCGMHPTAAYAVAIEAGCISGSVAEFERSIIRERQAEGIAKAKARGVYKGCAKVLDEEQVALARTWVREGIPKAEVARRLEIGRTTLYKYLNQ